MQDEDQFSLSITEVLAREVGMHAVNALKANFGGSRIYIPEGKSLHCKHPLVEAIGLDAARKISAELHRTVQYVPKATGDIESAILWATRAGLSREGTGRIAGCSDAYVYRMIAMAREAGQLPAREQAPVWKLIGYPSRETSPEADSHYSYMCLGSVEYQRRWPVVAWSYLAGINRNIVADLLDASAQQVTSIAGELRSLGYLPCLRRRKAA